MTILNKVIKQNTVIFISLAKEKEKRKLNTLINYTITYQITDVFPKDLSRGLLPIRDVHHQIDLVTGNCLPQLPHYKMCSKG